MEYRGKTADQIISNKSLNHSSWHFHQAMAWIDLAKRSMKVGPLHYAAFEIRYGIEYLLFQLLILTRKELGESEYKECLGDPKKMKQLLKNEERPYQKLSRFTELAQSLVNNGPSLLFWDLAELFRYWGKASKYLHFVGAEIHTYQSEEWVISSIADLESIVEPIWEKTTQTLGIALFDPNRMQPQVKDIWLEYLSDKITDETVLFRLDLIKPFIGPK